jgi:hypothetical protein
MSRRDPRTHRRRPSPETSLERILAAPHLAQIVPRLQPELIHRAIQHYGLESCAELVALASPGQLKRVFDLDLWRAAAPGLDEAFDANRFGEWIAVLVEAGAAGAADTLAALDVDLVATGLAQHVRVFDHAAVTPYVTLDGEQVSPGPAMQDGIREVGGFVLAPTRTQFLDAIATVLNALADAHAARFGQIMRTICALSNSRPEVDGLDELLATDEQAVFDLALEREGRRDVQGYVTPAQARAFLQTSRRLDLQREEIGGHDPMTRAYFRGVDAQAAIEGDDPVRDTAREPVEPEDVPADAIAAITDLFQELGVAKPAPRALLEGPETPAARLSCVRTHLQFVQERDGAAHARRTAELAYLANVIAAGSTIQSRPPTADEASNAAVAVCNLGLQNWPAHWINANLRRGLSVTQAAMALPEDFLIRHDLIAAFQVGWTVLHEDVCMYAADTLVTVLAAIDPIDDYVREELDVLRLALIKHCRTGSPWEARDALDVLAVLDTPAWASMLGLIDQLPTLHSAIGAALHRSTRRVDPSAFDFISENTQIQQIHEFLKQLPHLLRS